MIRFVLLGLILAVAAPAFAETSHTVNITTVDQKGGVIAGVVVSGVPAAPAALPSKLSREDLLDLELSGFKFSEMDRELERIREAAAKLRDHRDEVLKRYSVKFDDVGKSVTIMADGTIQRAAAAATPALPAKPTKLAKKK